jgi:hypothetical protein
MNRKAAKLFVQVMLIACFFGRILLPAPKSSFFLAFVLGLELWVNRWELKGSSVYWVLGLAFLSVFDFLLFGVLPDPLRGDALHWYSHFLYHFITAPFFKNPATGYQALVLITFALKIYYYDKKPPFGVALLFLAVSCFLAFFAVRYNINIRTWGRMLEMMLLASHVGVLLIDG